MQNYIFGLEESIRVQIACMAAVQTTLHIQKLNEETPFEYNDLILYNKCTVYVENYDIPHDEKTGQIRTEDVRYDVEAFAIETAKSLRDAYNNVLK